MSVRVLKYDLGAGVEAFSTERDSQLPYYVVQPHQVHGTVIREVTDPMTTRDELEGVDALVTNVPGVAISVRTADCIPVLMYDPINKAVAAVHAGWRGTVQRISQKMLSGWAGSGRCFCGGRFSNGTDTEGLRSKVSNRTKSYERRTSY